MRIISKIEVPKLHNSYLKRLEDILDASHEPDFVIYKPIKDAEISDCFNIISKQVDLAGGRLIFGWQVWLSAFLIEAEAHAVWETPNEELIDMTPKGFSIPRIVFIEDDNRKYENKQIDNIRLNITANKLVDDLITVCKEIFAFDNRGDRAYTHDMSDLLNAEQINHKLYMLKLKDGINFLLSNGGTRHSECFCNSTLKFLNCHGKDILEKLRRIE